MQLLHPLVADHRADASRHQHQSLTATRPRPDRKDGQTRKDEEDRKLTARLYGGGPDHRLQQEIARILAPPDVRERLLALGTEPGGSTPAQFSDYIRSETAKWAKIVKASGARAD